MVSVPAVPVPSLTRWHLCSRPMPPVLMNTPNITRHFIPLRHVAVFSRKTDIQPLINDGATKEDLSASIFQAVVNQTISGLACGKPIRGHVAFLGGPLHFLSELKTAFIRTLKLDDEHIIAPDNSHLFAAIGSALNAKQDVTVSLTELKERMRTTIKLDFEVERMEPLFATEDDYQAFHDRQSAYRVKTGDLSTYKGKCFLGIDAGSTTTKTALVSEDGTLLYSFYSSNNGNPLKTTINSIKEIYSLLPEDAELLFPAPPVTAKP